MQCCQSCCACANLVYTATKLVDAVGVVDNLIFNAINAVVNISFCLMQLAAVDSILGIFFYLTVCYVGNILAVCIQALIVDIGLVANFYAFIADGGLACGYSSCSYAYVFTNIQAILIQAYISTNLHAIVVHYSLAGGYAVKLNIFVQSNIIVLATVLIWLVALGYSNINALGNSSVFSCGCFYVLQRLVKLADRSSCVFAISNVITLAAFYIVQVANLVVQVVYSVNNGSMAAVLVLNIAGNIINIAYVTCFGYVVDYYLLVKLLAIFIKNV